MILFFMHLLGKNCETIAMEAQRHWIVQGLEQEMEGWTGYSICDYAIAMALYLEREKQIEELEDGSLSSLQG